MAFEAAVVLM